MLDGLHFRDLQKKFRVHHTTVSKVWREFVQTCSVQQVRYGAGGYSKLGHGEVQLIEHLKQAKPSITQAEIIDELHRYCNLSFGTSKSAVSRIVSERLNMTCKKLVKLKPEKFTPQNIVYCQHFFRLCLFNSSP